MDSRQCEGCRKGSRYITLAQLVLSEVATRLQKEHNRLCLGGLDIFPLSLVVMSRSIAGGP
jgi:hypothetical protein